MSLPLTRQATDNSGEKNFTFSFFCDTCGREWKSQEKLFMEGGFTGIKHEGTRKMLWEREHQAAFEQANLEAHMHFNCCPLCGKWVCDDCFRAEEVRHGGVCKNCAVDLIH